MTHPVVYGYMRIEGSAPEGEVGRLRRDMEEYAQSEGLALAEVFVDRSNEEDGGSAAFAGLMRALAATEAQAVLVPTPRHLARLPLVRVAMRAALEGVGVGLVEVGQEPPAPIHAAEDRPGTV